MSSPLTDLFNVVQTSKQDIVMKDSSIDYIKNLFKVIDITRLNIDWAKYLYIFYKNKLTFGKEQEKEINKKILNILTNKEIEESEIDELTNPIKTIMIEQEKLNHLNRFFHINMLFEKINELNISYNQALNYQDYTLIKCQNCYLYLITNSKYDNIIKHWFNGIFCSVSLNGENKSKYHKGIEILKNYLTKKDEIYNNYVSHNATIDKFIDIYADWSLSYLNEKYNKLILTFEEIFEKLIDIDQINKIFIEEVDRNIYMKKVIIGLIPCLRKYYDDIFENNKVVDNNVIDKLNMVDLNEYEYKNITLEFCKKWVQNIKNQIIAKNYCNSQLFYNLLKICPIIKYFRSGINKSDEIIKCLSEIYNIDKNLIGYVLTGLNTVIKTTYNQIIKNKEIILSNEIMQTLQLISLYDNKDFLWLQYFKNILSRINNLIKKHRISSNIITYEFDIYNYLIKCDCQAFSEKTKSLLNNIKDSVENCEYIHNCNINYIDENGNKKLVNNVWSNPDIHNVDYMIIDKYLWNLYDDSKQKNVLIDESVYPSDIEIYKSVGKTYYGIISETKSLEWDIDNSIINYNMNDVTLISKVVQYIILTTIANNKFDIKTLINFVINKSNKETNTNIEESKKYVESYVNNMIDKNIIKFDNILTINMEYIEKMKNQIIDLSSFVPIINVVKIELKQSSPEQKNNELITKEENPEYISYLRTLMLVKLFKTHSKKIYPSETIINSLNNHINKFIDNIKANKILSEQIKNLTKVSKEQLQKELDSLEKRDIIEKTTKNQITGYIYVP